MLILSRRADDVVLIGDDIRIVVLSCDRKGVRLGIEAPPEVNIVRGELALETAAENKRASATQDTRAWLARLAGSPQPPAPHHAATQSSAQPRAEDHAATRSPAQLPAEEPSDPKSAG
jgi:carbon storage regulator